MHDYREMQRIYVIWKYCHIIEMHSSYIAVINDMAALWALLTWVAYPFLFTGIKRARSIFYFGSKSLAVNYPRCPAENIEGTIKTDE